MSAYIIEQLRFGMWCFGYGMGITLFYDFLRIVRRVVRHSSLVISIEDFLYWVGVAIGIFLLLYYTNDGNLRWIAVLVVFFGMLLYKKIFGNKLVIFMSTIMSRTLHIVVKVLAVPQKLVKRAFLAGFRYVKQVFLKAKNGLTGNIKKGNIVLCKHLHVQKNSKKKGNSHEPQEIP